MLVFVGLNLAGLVLIIRAKRQITLFFGRQKSLEESTPEKLFID